MAKELSLLDTYSSAFWNDQFKIKRQIINVSFKYLQAVKTGISHQANISWGQNNLSRYKLCSSPINKQFNILEFEWLQQDDVMETNMKEPDRFYLFSLPHQLLRSEFGFKKCSVVASLCA